MIDRLLQAIAGGTTQAVYLVHGDLVLAEPMARKLAAALAERAGCEVDTRRRPPRLGEVLDDLRTLALFAPGKVALVVDSAVLADRSAAADLVDDAEKALPAAEEGELSARGREGATRLLQAIRLFDLDPYAGEPEAVLADLPAWALQGGKRLRRSKPRGRGKRQVEDLRSGLVELLAAARAAQLAGWAEGDVAELGTVARDGLPPGHALVLVEDAVAADHPIVRHLAELGAVAEAGSVASERGGGWSGLEALARELEGQTGVAITRDALAELARRTLRQERQGEVEAESTARFAAEYRKLATMAAGGRIDGKLVSGTVEDRGQEDVWKLLDAVGAGRGGEALDRLRRLLAAADDPVGGRLSFFGLLASFCRQLTALQGMMRLARVVPGERNYNRFKSAIAPRLQGELPDGSKNPLAGLHPYRLHRAYLAASRIPEPMVTRLPWRLLQTEMMLKGESDDPDAALADLVAHLAAGA
jgi:hypothetical protein